MASGAGRTGGLGARSIAVAVVLAGIAAVVVAQLGGQPHAKGSEPARRTRRFDWAAGRQDVYAVTWRATSARDVPGPEDDKQLEGGATFDGDVRIRSLGRGDAGLFTLVYAIGAMRAYGLEMNGRELVSEADRRLAIAALVGQEAIVTVDDRGQVASIGYHHDTALSTRDLLRRLVDMMRVTLPEAASDTSWNAREPTPSGLAHVHYEDDGDALRRVRLSYEGIAGLGASGEIEQHLSSRASIALDERGLVRAIEDHEDLQAQGAAGATTSRWIFTARRASWEPHAAAPVRLDDLDEATGESQLAEQRAHDRDVRLSEGWDTGSIEVQLELLGKGLRNDPKFVAMAAAYARLHPEACDHLVEWFSDPRLTDLGRQVLVDVLSAAGSPRAQAAMRAVLGTPPSRDPLLRGALVQRFVFVTDPTPESARFVDGVYRGARASGETRVAFRAAAALGAIVEHMRGQDELVRALDEELRTDLAERRSPQETVALVLALGNARQEDDLEAIEAFAGDGQPDVREQVARSLRRYDDPTASRALLDLAADDSPPVARAALQALREQSLVDDDWSALTRTLEQAPAASTRVYAATVDLLEQRPDCGPERTARIVRVVLDRVPDTRGNMDLRARARRLLEAQP